MGEHAEVTREDREAALLALDGEDCRSDQNVDRVTLAEVNAWIERGELPEVESGDEEAADAYAQVERVALELARVRIATEQAAYACGVREERDRVERWLRTATRAKGALISINSSQCIARLADDIAIGVHAKEGT